MIEVVHTSAQDESDLFSGTDAAPPAAAAEEQVLIEIQGVLVEQATVVDKAIGSDGQVQPVLRMELRPLNGARRTIVAEQVYSERLRSVAEFKALNMHKGARVIVSTSLQDMRTVLPHVQAVALIPAY